MYRSPAKYLQGILRTYRRICKSSFPTCNFYVSKYKGIDDCIKGKTTILFKLRSTAEYPKHIHFKRKKSLSVELCQH